MDPLVPPKDPTEAIIARYNEAILAFKQAADDFKAKPHDITRKDLVETLKMHKDVAILSQLVMDVVPSHLPLWSNADAHNSLAQRTIEKMTDYLT